MMYQMVVDFALICNQEMCQTREIYVKPFLRSPKGRKRRKYTHCLRFANLSCQKDGPKMLMATLHHLLYSLIASGVSVRKIKKINAPIMPVQRPISMLATVDEGTSDLGILCTNPKSKCT
jgi:hypothetical protein